MSGLHHYSHLFSVWLALSLFLNTLCSGDKRHPAFIAMNAATRRRKAKVHGSVAQQEDDAVAAPGLLDLPELAVEAILSRLPAQSLARAASVCRELHEKCDSDHLWQPLVEAKWGRVVGELAFKEWQSSYGSFMHVNPCKADDNAPTGRALINWPLSCIWSPWTKPFPIPQKLISTPNVYQKWHSTLETGAYWFPAQVFNRENGHIGFLLSCYDAELCYDRQTDTFKARYPPHGSCAPILEEGITWQRLRKPPTPTTAHELYASTSLNGLRPGDHIEVQWRRNKRFPYGWWYGVVAHLDTCDKDSRHCRCHLDDAVWLEFHQYAEGSRWRRTEINRGSHTEKGDDTEGFYAGVRKLTPKEASAWRQLWPKDTLE